MKGLFSLNIDYSKRIFGLDILRALAIIDVVIIHGRVFMKDVDLTVSWFKRIPGVPLFFVLSGFLIGQILIKVFEQKSVSPSSIITFFKRRWFRTLPNYYLILLVNILIVYFGVIKEDFSQFNASFFFFTQNLTEPFHGFFWESWSITIEEWFYLSFPLALLAIVLLFPTIKTKSKFLIVVSAFIVVPTLLRYFSMNDPVLWAGYKIKGTVIHSMDNIAFGFLAAFIKVYYNQLFTRFKKQFLLIGILLIFWVLYREYSSFIVFEKVFTSSLLSLGLFFILPFFDGLRIPPNLLVKAITHVSLVSYSMYLVNLAIVAEVIRDNFMPIGVANSIITYCLYWLIVIGLSTLLYKFFEKPMMDLRDRDLSFRSTYNSSVSKVKSLLYLRK